MERCDCAQYGLEGWHAVAGQWGVEDIPDAPSGQRALVQRATENACNVIVAPSGPYTAMDISVRFKPMAGREDAASGLIVHFAEGQYSRMRANTLEDNVRLYAYDRGRHQLATVRVSPSALGQWHTIWVVAVGESIQASLNGALLLEHRDARSAAGQVRPWTKADSMTGFDDLVIRGMLGT